MKPSASKRVLMLVENSSYPGDYRVRKEANALYAAGYGVAVICPSQPGLAWREVVDGVLVYRYPAPPGGRSFLGYCWEYTYSLIATFLLSLLVWLYPGFDIIHAANPPDTTCLMAAFYKLFGKRFVYDQHDLAPELYYARFGGKGNSLVYRALVWLERLSCRLADHVIATNQSFKSVEMQRGHVPEARITVVRNGPDLKHWSPGKIVQELKQQDKTLIAYMGIIEIQDGVDYLLRALRHLMTDLGRSDFRCVIIGDGGALPKLKHQSTHLGLTGFVSFTGWLERQEIPSYLSCADICVAPEPSNALNDRSTVIKIMEYMAVARPVVAFDLPEHRVTAQNAAIYARANNELDLARKIASLMDDRQKRMKMGKIGRQRIESELAWSHQQKYLLEAYESISTGFPGRTGRL